MRLEFQALRPDRWADLVRLFGEKGACGGCWCMWWRLGRAEWTASKGAGNRRRFAAIVESGAEPGILAYDGKTPVAWCAVEPRERYVALERSRVLKRIDDHPVWSVTCLFVAKPYRRRGVTVELLREAVRFAAGRGATCVEGYPVEPKQRNMPDAFAWTGLRSAFEKAGFVEAGRGSASRPVMRCRIGGVTRR